MTHVQTKPAPKPHPTTIKLRELSDGWGALPSIAPYLDEAPQLTTGHAVWLTTRAATEIDQLRAAMSQIMQLSAEPGAEAQKLNEIHRCACIALQGGR